jgi:zinc-ribbon domain
MPVRECANCGTGVAGNARFCPECGRSLDPAGGPLDAPVHARAWFRPRVSERVVLVAVGALVVGAVLGARGAWAWALVAILAAAVVLLSLDRLAGGRRPVADLRARAAAARETMAARSREQVELFRARRELTALESERTRLFRDLGRAVYDGDGTGTRVARSGLDDVASAIEAKEAEIEVLKRETSERVDEAQASARPTERLRTAPQPLSDEGRGAVGDAASPGRERPPA